MSWPGRCVLACPILRKKRARDECPRLVSRYEPLSGFGLIGEKAQRTSAAGYLQLPLAAPALHLADGTDRLLRKSTDGQGRESAEKKEGTTDHNESAKLEPLWRTRKVVIPVR